MAAHAHATSRGPDAAGLDQVAKLPQCLAELVVKLSLVLGHHGRTSYIAAFVTAATPTSTSSGLADLLADDRAQVVFGLGLRHECLALFRARG
jgi:hypothetical protein